ncbi:MAG TPA: outer membrane beta-barrel protein [Vicinamibacterales bacterium]
MKKLMFGAFLVTLVAAAPASAQGDGPVHFNIGGGFTVPVFDDASRAPDDEDPFGTGGGFNIGLTFEPTPVFGIQVEYAFNRLAGKDREIPLTTPVGALTNGLIESHHNMQYIDFNGVFKMAGDALVKPYGIGGFGMYYRSVSLTSPDIGFTTWCDPYWYVCYPTAVEVDRILGDRSTWDPGINFGGGVTFALGDEAAFYVETRWHYMWGPEVTDFQGQTRKVNGQYWPVTFGFRF